MDIIRDILDGVKSKPVYIDTDRARALEDAILSSEEDKIIAVIGKGIEKYYIDKSGYHEYDEIALIKEVLTRRGDKNENKA